MSEEFKKWCEDFAEYMGCKDDAKFMIEQPDLCQMWKDKQRETLSLQQQVEEFKLLIDSLFSDLDAFQNGELDKTDLIKMLCKTQRETLANYAKKGSKK